MELTLSERDITNTIFSSNGSAKYRTAKKAKAFGTAASTRIYKGTEQVGIVRLASWNKPDTVDVRGRTLNLYGTSFWSSSEAFTASDGRSYKWKLPGGTSFTLYSVENGHAKDRIAHYDHGSYGIFSRGRPPKLFIGSQGLHIADEIITTLVYMMRKLQQRRNSAAASSGAAGAAAAGASSC
ncbi:hypothetical protein VKT23_018731 [Stygiomarasmius scandens]|uniref:DUF6593 domain-containing protein n=1 Tax=Marasmiellus scandens TaxID=2682957 RepID=A0ABR1ISG7_9AGAR